MCCVSPLGFSVSADKIKALPGDARGGGCIRRDVPLLSEDEHVWSTATRGSTVFICFDLSIGHLHQLSDTYTPVVSNPPIKGLAVRSHLKCWELNKDHENNLMLTGCCLVGFSREVGDLLDYQSVFAVVIAFHCSLPNIDLINSLTENKRWIFYFSLLTMQSLHIVWPWLTFSVWEKQITGLWTMSSPLQPRLRSPGATLCCTPWKGTASRGPPYAL